MTRTDSRFFLAALVLPLSLAAFPSAVLAEDIVWDGSAGSPPGTPTGTYPSGSLGVPVLIPSGPSGNTVTVTGNVLGYVFGGGVYNGSTDVPLSSSGNTVTLSGGVVGWDVRGGYARSDFGFATATGNSVILSGGEVRQDVSGGDARSDFGSATATGNSVTLSGAELGGDVVGGEASSDYSGSATATGNTVTISGGNVVGGSFYGGNVLGGYAWSNSGSATVTNNRVIISGGSVSGSVYGGEAWSDSGSGSATATGNSVTISGGLVGWVSGGNARSASSNSGPATATGNSVTINGGSVDWVFGGEAWSASDSATATGNSVTVNGGLVDGDIFGGFADSNSADKPGDAKNNTVVISGGRVTGDIYGGFSLVDTGGKIGSATDNTVSISGTPVFGSGTLLYGGFVGQDNGTSEPGDAFTGNTLNLHSAGLTVSGLYNFQYLNFYLPTTLVAGATVLTVNGTADITNSQVNVGVEGASSPLRAGDEIILIDAATLAGAPVNSTANGQGMQGVSLRYEFDILTDAANNQLRATVTSAGADERAKALSEGYLSGVALVNQSVDLAAGKGIAALRNISGNIGAFAVLGGASSRYDTGSHVDVDSLSLIAGVAGELKTDLGKLSLGAFFSHGQGDYDTHNSFANVASVKGKGDTDHSGLGLLARLDFTGTRSGHPYAEASLQGGRVESDFKSGDLRDSLGRGAKYDTRSSYYGAHIGAGYLWKLGEAGEVDLYGQYLYARRGGDSVRLNTGDPIRFSAVESQRLRIGGRYAWTANKIKPYAGLAWEHEFDGKAKATAYGYRIDAPDLKGDTGIVEFGLSLTPSKNTPVSIDLGLQGYAGTREGVSGGIKLEYRF